MAGAIKGITVEIGGDTTKLGKALADVNKQSKSLQSELKGVNTLLKMDPSNVTLLKQKQDILNSSIATTKDKLDTLKTAQVQVQEQFDKGEITEEQYRDFQREIVNTEQKLKSLEDEAKSFGSVAEQQFKQAGESVKAVGEKVSGAGEKLKGVSAGAAALGAASVAACIDMDSGYDTVITKTGATGDALDDLKSQVDKVFTDLPTSAEDAGIAIGEVNTRFGLTGEACADLSEEFIKFANINGTDLNTSIDNVDSIMTKFGVDSKDTGKVLGLLTKAGQDTGLSMETLETALTTNGSTFKEMGLDITGATNLLAQFEANGVDSSTALAGLKKAQQNATASGKTLDESLGDTIDSIKNASSETDALQIATELFGKKGAAEMTQAIREGRFSVDDLTGSLEDYGTTVSDTFDATLDPWDDAKVAMNNLELAGSQLGESLLTALAPVINGIVSAIKSMTEWFTNLDPGIKTVIATVLVLVAGLAPLLLIVGKVITTIGTIMTVVAPIVTFITGTVIPAISAVVAAINWPVVAIAAVIAAVVLLYNKCEWFRDGVNAVITKIKKFVDAAVKVVVAFFTTTIPTAFNGFVTFITGAVTSIGTFFTTAWTGIVTTVSNAVTGVKTVWGTIVSWFQSTIINPIVTAFNTFVTTISTAATNLWTAVKNVFVNVITWINNTIITPVRTAVTTLFNGLSTAATNLWIGIKNVFVNVITWVQNTVLTPISTAVTTAFNNIKTAATNLWIGIKNVFINVGSWFTNKFNEAYTAVKNAFSNIGSFFSGIWSNIKTTFSSLGTAIGNAIGSAVKSGINGVISMIENTVNSAVGLINGAIGLINKIPGVSVGKISKLSLPRLAQGGVLEKGQVGLLEGDGAEAVVPLEKNTEWINRVAEKLNGAGSSDALLNRIDKLETAITNMRIVLDTGTLVGATVSQYDRALGQSQLMKARGI